MAKRGAKVHKGEQKSQKIVSDTGEEKTEKITVIVRVRPLQIEETNQRSPWKLSTKSIASSKTCRPSVPCHSFTFDKVYGTKSTTFEIYEAHIKAIVNSAVSGVNGTVIAYGQSGSGKTYTMRGEETEDNSILLLAVRDMFKRVQEAEDREFLVRVSYFEVVNDELVDLLASKRRTLDVQEDLQDGIVLGGLREEIVVGSEQVFSLVQFADAQSSVGSRVRRSSRSHSIIRMVIESRLDNQEDQTAQAIGAVQVSVLNLVEVGQNLCDAEGAVLSHRETKPDKNMITLQKVMSMLSECSENQGESVPYTESKLTHILRPSLGGNTRTCFICHISPAMIHMDDTVATLVFGSKAIRTVNRFSGNENWRGKALLKNQRREIKELRSKLKEDHSQDWKEEIVNRKNALLMIELERDQMSIELKEQEGEKKDNMALNGDSGALKCIEMGDFNKSPENSVTEYLRKSEQNQELKETDHHLQPETSRSRIGPYTGKKRKRRPSSEMVADKIQQGDILFQCNMSRELDSTRSESFAERQQLTELQVLMAQQKNEHQELLAIKEHQCSSLRQRISDLEIEKVIMEKRLQEQEITYTEEIETLKGLLATHKAKEKNEGITASQNFHEIPDVTIQNQAAVNGQAKLSGELQQIGMECQESLLKEHTDVQSCLLQDTEDHQKVLKEDAQHIPMKKKFGHSKATKVCQKYETFQNRSEVANLRKQLAVAKDAISTLKDERDSLWRDLKQVKTESRESQENFNNGTIEENYKIHQLLAAAMDELKAEVESTIPITDALLELISESFQALAADLQRFQEGVADLKVIRCASGDLSESLEKAKQQLVALRQGKLASENELHCMKSELVKLECVVERQSGVLKVLSDNEVLLHELSSVKAAMKEAAGAYELQLSSIQQEYNTKVKELELECQNGTEEHRQLEEKYTNIKLKLQIAEAEVLTLTKSLGETSELEKKHKDTQRKLKVADAEVIRLTQALEEKSNRHKKHTYSKSRQSKTEAEIVRLTKSVGEKSELEIENGQLQADISSSRAEIGKLERELEEKTLAHREVLINLASTEGKVVELMKAWEAKIKSEEEIQLKAACKEDQLVKKVESFTQEVEEMKKMEFNYSQSLDRLVRSETEVARLTEIVGTYLDEKSMLEQDHTNILYKLETSEMEVRRIAEHLTILRQEKETLEKEHKNLLTKLSIAELQVARLTENLTTEKETRAILESKHKETLDKIAHEQAEREILQKENEELSEQISDSQVEMKCLEDTHQKMLEKLTSDQEQRDELEKSMKSTAIEFSLKQEENLLQKRMKAYLDKLGVSESNAMALTQRLVLELQEKSNLEKGSEETPKKIATGEDDKKLLEQPSQTILDKLAGSESKLAQVTESLTKELQEKNKLESVVQEALHKLTTEQEERKLLEQNSQIILDKLTCSDSKLAELTETLTKELQEKYRLEKEYECSLDKLVREQEHVTEIKKKHQETLVELTHEKQDREILENIHQTILEQLAGTESKLTELTSIHQDTLVELTHEKEDGERLESIHQTILEQLAATESKVTELTRTLQKTEVENLGSCGTKEEDQKALEKIHQETLLELSVEREEREALEKLHQTILEKLAESEFKVVQLTSSSETLTRRVQEANTMEKDYQEILNNLTRVQDELNELQKINQETLNNLNKEQDQRELLQKSHQSTLSELNSLESKLEQLAETLFTEQKEKNLLQKDFQDILDKLTREQHEKMSLETKSQEILEKLTREHELNREQERNLMEKTRQKILSQLGDSEAKVIELTDSLTAESEAKIRLENKCQDIVLKLADEKELVKMNNQETLDMLRTEKYEMKLWKTNYQDAVNNLELKVVDVTESLAGENEGRNRLKLELGEILDSSHFLKSEVIRLTQSLATECEMRKNLDMVNNTLLTQLANSNIEVERLTGTAIAEAERKESLKTEHYQILAELASSQEEVRNLTNKLEDLQVILADSEARILRQTDELTDKSRIENEHKLLELELCTRNSEVKDLNSEKKTLQKEQVELVTKISSTEAELQKLKSELGGKLRLEEEYKGIIVIVASLKEEVLHLKDSLAEKSGLEEEHQKSELELHRKQGEVSKLTKELKVHRKVIKEQKQLIRKLTSTQVEVLRLTNALGGRPELANAVVDQNTKDIAEVGSGCVHCGKYVGHQEAKLQKNLAQTEAEVVRLTSVIKERALLENEHESVQLDLSIAQAEIERLKTLLEDKAGLDVKLRTVQRKLSEAGVLESGNGINCLEELPVDLVNVGNELIERKRELERKEAQLQDKERGLKDREISSDVDYEALNTIISMREKERDELREQFTLAECKLKRVHAECEKKLETIEKQWKNRSQKLEKEAAELRNNFEKFEEATGWLLRDKNAVEERLVCCETQLNVLREASLATNNELELSRHQIHILTVQHESEIAGLCEEISVKKAQIMELEGQLKRLLNHAPLSLQELNGFSPNPSFRGQQWLYPKLLGPLHEPLWGEGPTMGPR